MLYLWKSLHIPYLFIHNSPQAVFLHSSALVLFIHNSSFVVFIHNSPHSVFFGFSSDPSPQSSSSSQVQLLGIHFPVAHLNCHGSHSRDSQSLSSDPSPQSSSPSQILKANVQFRLSHWNWPVEQWRTAEIKTWNEKTWIWYIHSNNHRSWRKMPSWDFHTGIGQLSSGTQLK